MLACLKRFSDDLRFWSPTWSDTNKDVQLQKMAGGLNFQLICVFVFAYAKCFLMKRHINLSFLLYDLTNPYAYHYEETLHKTEASRHAKRTIN